MKKGRVIGGVLKGRIINMPQTKEIRPTSDALKERIFNILLHRFFIDFSEIVFFDLFAGSGAMGIEAISLGSKRAVFFDISNMAIRSIKNNIESLKIQQFSKIVHSKIERVSDELIKNLCSEFKKVIIFFDPPYDDKILLNSQVDRFSKLFEKSAKEVLMLIETNDELSFDNLTLVHKITNGYRKVFFGKLLATNCPQV